MKRILFVCTGNTCRSPMAEGLLKHHAEHRQQPLEVRSAGLMASNGAPVSSHSARILADKGISVDTNGSQGLNQELIDWADLILSMTMSHKKEIIQRFPQSVDKTYTLKEYTESGTLSNEQLAERDELMAEWHMQQSLAEEMNEERMRKLLHYLQASANYDISDPFGGSLEHYRQCADDIEQALDKLLDQLADN